MNKEKILNELHKYAQKDAEEKLQINCADAYKVAYTLNVKIAEVAQELHDNNIKILKCQLGCF